MGFFNMKLAALFAAATLQSPSTTSYTGFSVNGHTLSPDDVASMQQSIVDVLDKGHTGAQSGWSSDDGLSGRATLLRTYLHDGHACGDVVHVMTAGGTDRYRYSLCKFDGVWKLVPAP
jgi:hypothetical protein